MTSGPISLSIDLDALVDILAPRIAELIRDQPTKVDPPSPFLTVPEAATYLRASRQRIYDLLSSRAVPKVKDGSRVLLRRDDLDAYLSGRPLPSRDTSVTPITRSRSTTGSSEELGDNISPCHSMPDEVPSA